MRWLGRRRTCRGRSSGLSNRIGDSVGRVGRCCGGARRQARMAGMESPTAVQVNVKPRRKRRWFQFGLGTLLGLVTLMAVWLGALVNRAERQLRAVAAVQRLGGDVAYADEGLSWTPEWLRAWAREGYFQTVTAVSLMNVTQVTDADLTHLEGLTGLQLLWLHDTQVSDAGLEHLKGLNAIQELDLSNTQVSDAGLKHLKGMSSLQRLWLINTHVSDEGIAELRAALPNCNIEASMPTVTAP